MVALVGCTENKMGFNVTATSSILPQVSQGEQRGTPQDGSTLHFLHLGESYIESSGGAPNVLDSEDQDFLINYIRSGTRGTYSLGWHQFLSFCKGQKVNAKLTLLAFIVKFICYILIVVFLILLWALCYLLLANTTLKVVTLVF